jgi:hypothetical protein
VRSGRSAGGKKGPIANTRPSGLEIGAAPCRWRRLDPCASFGRSPHRVERHDMAETIDVLEAARRLGVTPDAVRARLRRGTLEDYRDNSGNWRIVSTDTTACRPTWRGWSRSGPSFRTSCRRCRPRPTMPRPIRSAWRRMSPAYSMNCEP